MPKASLKVEKIHRNPSNIIQNATPMELWGGLERFYHLGTNKNHRGFGGWLDWAGLGRAGLNGLAHIGPGHICPH